MPSLCRLCAVALVLALTGTGPASAAAKKIPDPQTADDAFVAAREAAHNGDLAGVMDMALRLNALDPNYPLAAYTEYWQISQRLKSRIAPIGDDEVRAFLARNEGSVSADLARREWLLALGKRADFATFDSEYPRFLLNDDAQVSCYALLSRYLHREDVLDAAKAALAVPRSLDPGATLSGNDGCNTLASTLAADGKLTQAEIWAWVRLASDANLGGVARRYLALLPEADQPTPKQFDLAYDHSAVWLTKVGSIQSHKLRELVVLALARMARNDPGPTADLFQREWEARLPEGMRAYVWAQLGASAARKLMIEASEWSRRSIALDGLSDDILAWQVRAALRAEDWRLVHALIDKMPPATKRDPTWAYWLGRAFKFEGRYAEAEAQFRIAAPQIGFYGQLAQEELGQPTIIPARGAGPTDVEVIAARDNPGFIRSLKAYQLNLRTLANLEWNFTLRGMTDRQLLAAAEWARRNDILDRAVNTADRTRSEHDFTMRFLSPFKDQMRPKAAAYHVGMDWVYGLIRQESRFVQVARSNVGASGLMQIMPGTASFVARKLGMADYHAGQVNDLDTNLTLGTGYLRMLLDALDNQEVLATAAYNAGPGRSRTWRGSLLKPVEGAIFAETIPFTETRDYVKKVMSNAVYYSALFDGRPVSLRARLGMVSPVGSVPLANAGVMDALPGNDLP